MEKSLKFYSTQPKHDDVDKDKQIFKTEDQLWKQLSPSEKIKINDSENQLSKAFEQQKFPSLHEALGPALTGFLLSDSFSSGKLNQEIFFSRSIFRKLAS